MLKDLKLFAGIKEWELSTFSNMNEDEKMAYRKGLEKKLEIIKETSGRIPQSFSFSNKKWRFESDIEQITWRLGYLK